MIASYLVFLITGISAHLVERQGNSQCAQWCAQNFPTNPGFVCTSPAAHGKGPCYDCGPAKPQGSTKQLCNGACVDTNTDNNNCGSCGNQCVDTEDGDADTCCVMGQCVDDVC
ncbi:hypothetical protein DER46DRAFT_665785 [Fusarium sp. MPI-SDFR-AT-0072]|nr:hypothetical protein DER46DRAFT_665785 [Fusarium sp. MPI-SDFR-AT-0072]